MAKIGSWWLKGVEAEPGEEVRWSQGASRIQRSGRAVGGKLFLTDGRVVFCPHWVDGATGGKTWDAPLATITGVGTIPKGSAGGGVRDRLKIELADGEFERFVVNRLDKVVARLSDSCGVRRQPSPNPGSPAAGT